MKKSFYSYDINAILLEPASQCDKLIPDSFQHSGFAYFMVFSFLRIMKSIMDTIIHAPLKYKFAGINTYCHLYDKKILFRLPTLNNKRTLARVIDIVSREKNNVQVIEKELDSKTYPLVLIYLVSLCNLPSLWRGFKSLNEREKRIACYFMAYFAYTPGVVWFYNHMLKNHRPECVVLANDHTFVTKPLEYICEEFDIPCMYIQHASVSSAFPELHFSCSFLDGIDSLEKYTSNNKQTRGKIVLLGAGRYDFLGEYRMKRDKRIRKCIGIAINDFDDNKKCDNTCNFLLERFPDITIKVRMHPSMKDRPFIFSNKERVISTCATDETIIEYLDSIDLQISNDSGVHLDAVLGGVRTIAYNLSNYEFGDNYEYLKNGLIYLAKDVDELAKCVEDPLCFANDITKIRRYDESFGKTYAGHCSDIIADFILSNSNMKVLSDKYNMERKYLGEHEYYVIKD